MAITNGYLTLAEIKAWLATDQTVASANDSLLEASVEAASREIDRWCGQRFWTEDSDVTRYFTGAGDTVRLDPPVHTITSISTSTSLTTGYDTTWTVSTEYRGEPLNAPTENAPWTTLRALTKHWPTHDGAVKIIGRFGWPAVPADVKHACRILAARLYLRKSSPEGVIGFDQIGAVRVSRIDSDVRALLEPFRYVTVA